MAGGFAQNPNSKSKNIKQNSEILKESPINIPHKNKPSGILSPGESIDFHQEKSSSINWGREFLSQTINKEQTVFINQHSQEIQKEIQDLKSEIHKLIEITEDIDTQIEIAVDQNIVEFSEYQLNFFKRIKIYISNFRKNISNAGVWLESFTHKKNRRDAFWNKAKSGGQKYQESGEHSASRSAN